MVSFLPKTRSRSDTLRRGRGALDVKVVSAGTVDLPLLQTFPDTHPEHLGERPKAAVSFQT